MDHDNYPDSYIRGILNTVKTIAMVGISPKDNRPSYFAFKYLLDSMAVYNAMRYHMRDEEGPSGSVIRR